MNSAKLLTIASKYLEIAKTAINLGVTHGQGPSTLNYGIEKYTNKIFRTKEKPGGRARPAADWAWKTTFFPSLSQPEAGQK